MGYAFVFVVAAAVGVAVYVFTIREGSAPAIRPDAPSTGGGGGTGSASAYVPVTGGRPDWQSRLTGLLGLVVAVVVGGVALAATLYLVVSFLVRAIGGTVN